VRNPGGQVTGLRLTDPGDTDYRLGHLVPDDGCACEGVSGRSEAL